MRSVRLRVRESRGCAVLAVLASDQRGALGASLLAPKAPRPSPGPEGLLLSARGLSRRDCKSPFFVFYKGRLAGRFARLLARKAFSSLLEGSRGETASRPFLFSIKGALQAPVRAADRHWQLLGYSIGSIVSQDEPSGSSRKRVRLSNRPSSFQHCGWLMFTSARGRRSGNRSWTV